MTASKGLRERARSFREPEVEVHADLYESRQQRVITMGGASGPFQGFCLPAHWTISALRNPRFAYAQ
jgi:hypothetical protein